MKTGRGANAIGMLLEGETVREVRIFQLLDAGEMLVDQRRVGQRP
jgi:hypothetical protein